MNAILQKLWGPNALLAVGVLLVFANNAIFAVGGFLSSIIGPAGNIASYISLPNVLVQVGYVAIVVSVGRYTLKVFG